MEGSGSAQLAMCIAVLKSQSWHRLNLPGSVEGWRQARDFYSQCVYVLCRSMAMLGHLSVAVVISSIGTNTRYDDYSVGTWVCIYGFAQLLMMIFYYINGLIGLV